MRFLIHFSWIFVQKFDHFLSVFSVHSLAAAMPASVHSNNPLKTINFQTKNPRKMNQKPHQKINKFYFIYKSPRVMLVTAENTWNDV